MIVQDRQDENFCIFLSSIKEGNATYVVKKNNPYDRTPIELHSGLSF